MSSPWGLRRNFHFIWEWFCFCSYGTRDRLLFLFSVFADCVPFPNLRAGCEIILSCCHSTVSRTLSLRRIRLVPSSLPINSLAGVLPEAVCGVSLYVKRNSQAFYSVRFDPFLKLKKTALVFLLQCTFVGGFYGAEVVCTIVQHELTEEFRSTVKVYTLWSRRPKSRGMLTKTSYCKYWRILCVERGVSVDFLRWENAFYK